MKIKTYLPSVIYLVLLVAFCVSCGKSSQNKVERKKMVTLYVSGDMQSYEGKEEGWFAELIKKKFGIELVYVSNANSADNIDIIEWPHRFYPKYIEAKEKNEIYKEYYGVGNGDFNYLTVISICESSQHKEKCKEFLDYLNSPLGMMEILYGPKDKCWTYDNQHVELLDKNIDNYDVDKAPHLLFRPYLCEAIDPNTDCSYQGIGDESSIQAKFSIGSGEKSDSIYFMGNRHTISTDNIEIKRIINFVELADQKTYILVGQDRNNCVKYFVYDSEQKRIKKELDIIMFIAESSMSKNLLLKEDGLYNYSNECLYEVHLRTDEKIMFAEKADARTLDIFVFNIKSNSVREIEATI